MCDQFQATHRITFAPVSGKPERFDVMEREGSLYTQTEWVASVGADWTIDNERHVWFQGQAAPGNGTVRVKKL